MKNTAFAFKSAGLDRLGPKIALNCNKVYKEESTLLILSGERVNRL